MEGIERKKRGDKKRDKLNGRQRDRDRERGHVCRMEIKYGIKMASDFSKVAHLLVYYKEIYLNY